ncbi:MAG TPA: amylo-alpha-1,6-glucosidase [Methylomirabilota bacterium]
MVRRLAGRRHPAAPESLITAEWLVTNGLGGYASGTVAGVITRRYHGLLVAALPAPHGRVVMLSHVWERLRLQTRRIAVLSSEEHPGVLDRQSVHYLDEFRLEYGLPVWRFEIEGLVMEKRVLLPYRQNTVHVTYQLLEGEGPVRLTLRPSVNFRPHGAPVDTPLGEPYVFTAVEDRYEIRGRAELPPLRMLLYGSGAAFTTDGRPFPNVLYRVEGSRGYEAQGSLWSPGYFRADLSRDRDVTLVASTEPWEHVQAVDPEHARAAEGERRTKLVRAARSAVRQGPAAELVLAADQFIITPRRLEDAARQRAAGEEARSVIAGYHWFTDWGRDTMISLEGLTLLTGRAPEASWILRTFADYVRNGLLPNLFPEAGSTGLYHTADATLWFFHAIDRYLDTTGNRDLLEALLPRLVEIVEHHLKGTDFGIGVDERDGLLRQGAPDYALSWMDAKVGDWVVTPRRGKAVEINALWYNALTLLREWVQGVHGGDAAGWIEEQANRARRSFNARFWYDAGGYLYDVVDGESGDDPACRPNQILAFSLRHPVLDRARWGPVLEVVRKELLTPVGLRSLAPSSPEFKARYDGDLRARDAAYHQGTVWAWLIGPFIDAWLRVHPDDRPGARRLLNGLIEHLGEAGLGSISEVFDAEAPFTPRGCIAQAWSVAEVIRSWVRTASEE